MHVVATAGHVDHGKSTLVRALTGMEPDRWAEERRRGMTIDLGYAWMTLPSGAVLAFVDVPGHARFLGNMLAGVGPAPAVLFVVAADEGWREQSTEHLAAVDALGLKHGLLVVTRSDLADPGPAMAASLVRLGASSLGDVPAVAVSGATGAGLDVLRKALDRLVAGLPAAVVDERVRLWVDRSFTIRGSGTVVTGTLAAGTVRVGDELALSGRPVRVRGLQSLGAPHDQVCAAARVAVNLRGVDKAQVSRGDALVTPQVWWQANILDVRLCGLAERLPAQVVLHVGTAAVPVRVRPLGADAARLQLARPLPLQVGDRALLRDPGARTVVAGVVVLDVDPPPLRRRGAAAARAAELHAERGLRAELQQRGAMRAEALSAQGFAVGPADGVRVVGSWLMAQEQWSAWGAALCTAVDRHAAAAPLEAGLPHGAAVRELGLPDRALLGSLIGDAGLEDSGGRIRRPGAAPALGAGVGVLEARLAERPFTAPEQPELDALGISRQHVAAAVASGRLLRLPDGVLLLPDAPARAMQLLSTLPQPFTVSAARQVLGTTRRVAIPLLEHLDGRGWTRRVDRSHRAVVRRTLSA